ncbi:MAG TPA: cytochrome P460 family protein [Bryobacteraceae bacterium]|jgi:hypothetical protein|nr:cytochrome P460 family protein [Bryobacteraceae bacterium]
MRFLLLVLAVSAMAADPDFNKAGELARPSDYREWIYLTTGLGMNYASGNSGENPPFDNVFVLSAAYREFKATGHWPEHTIFVIEPRQSMTKGSINKAGHYQGERLPFLEAAVKDSKRFTSGWAYFSFEKETPAVKAFPQDSGCNECHGKNAAVENTFVQFYPTLLEIAKAKGTLRDSYLKSGEGR